MNVPSAALAENTIEYETLALVAPTGFREYDARFLYRKDINLNGVRAFGLGFGTLLHELGIKPQVVTGHDFREYSGAVKQALITGLMASGCVVHDIGLALSPMAYFAQFALDVPAVAIVTASHNENGWTGFKLGMEPPFTLGPGEMSALKDIVLGGKGRLRPGGALIEVEGMADLYLADLAREGKLKKPLKVVCACGNGTAGTYAPRALADIGCEVVPLDCGLDYTFPRYNPNPEDIRMLDAMGEAVRENRADLALGFDGDGDRCGVVDDKGIPVFADKIGVLIARDIVRKRPGTGFVADIKATGLFASDPVLKANGTRIDYWKTGHSYMKRRVHEFGATAGFEKSGHYFFAPPLGRGYDDGLLSGIAICRMLDAAGKPLSTLIGELPRTWSTPTMSPHCPDEIKYDVIKRITERHEELLQSGAKIEGAAISGLTTVNGMRMTLTDGTWGLIRASSNKPELVVVCESPTSEAMMIAMFRHLEAELATFPEIGAYNQKI